MIWDSKYHPREHEIICPVCKNKLERIQWEDFGMHYECTEYYRMKYYLERGFNYDNEKMNKNVTKTMINEI
jgi:hypothetical protein